MNTQEKESELGNGMYSAEFWMYDGKLGRRWNIDPVISASESSYACFHNSPIKLNDIKGDYPSPSAKITKGQGPTQFLKANGFNATTKEGWLSLLDNLYRANPDLFKGYDIKESAKNKWNYWNNQKKYTWKVDQDVSIYPNVFIKQSEKNKERIDFLTWPEVLPSSGPSPKILQKRNMDEAGNFKIDVNTFSGLLRASLTGVEVANIKGGALEALKSSIQNFYGPTGSDAFDPLIKELNSSGKDYFYSGRRLVRFGPTSKSAAYLKESTYLMRNATMQMWIEKIPGKISFYHYKIEVRVYDLFNVTPQNDKGGVYNFLGGVLNPLHKAAGGNINMQTRAEWIFYR